MGLKVVHTADWHLGQSFFGYDREEEHDAFLGWLTDTLTERQTDVLLISGDVFDVANPSASAQRRFYQFLKETNRRNPDLQVVVIAGNHDSAVRLEVANPLLEALGVTIIGLVKRTEEGAIDYASLLIPLTDRRGERKAWCMAVPFLRQGDYPPPPVEEQDTYVNGINRMYHELYAWATTLCRPDEAIVAIGHLHATGAELSDDDRSERIIMGGLESVSADTFASGIAYTALGHIHKAQRVGGREEVRYAGSPLPMSFSETGYCHQVIAVELEGKQLVAVEPLPVPRLVELLRVPVRPASPDEVMEALVALPDAPSTSLKPYLEVRVLLTEPDPGFRHRVEEVLTTKAVRLTSIQLSYPKREETDAIHPLSYTDLQKIDPLDMLRHTYAARYVGELPEEIEQLFMDVMREVAL